ncbi:MAG: tRNA (N(6)-L-threonylcarbamoyladenosine(37)-C(2))-methylthiotransferase MtaB, partial [Clostridia bacterium]|nr:tRNA (N(6)-L-threonylcarbamoyladenosine(37)-C(2))-methylthiotransferase MtaB [Clostridia bacterium]
MSPTFAICTLGCKVNQEESRQIAAALSADGWREVAFNDKADCYIVNTCTVTHLADRKSRAMLRRAVRANPAAYIVAAGCFSQVSPQEAAKIEGIDLIIGVEERHLLPQLLAEKAQGVMVGDIKRAEEFKSIYSVHQGTERARAFLKIEDGCNEACAYCKIPQARGPVRSWPIAEVLQAARELIAAGHAEIVLT